MHQRAIFLDRDGVLNQAIVRNGKPYPPASVDQVIVPADVLSALNSFVELGYLLIGVTNQPDVARGIALLEDVEAINAYLLRLLPLNEINVCFHDNKDNCSCRKPNPGLLIEAAKKHNINLQLSIMIGDRWKDIAAGQKAGCKTIWINHHYNEQPACGMDAIVTSMFEAEQWVKNVNHGSC